MGTKQSEIKKDHPVEPTTIRHPRFEKVKLLSHKDDQYLQITAPVVNET